MIFVKPIIANDLRVWFFLLSQFDPHVYEENNETNWWLGLFLNDLSMSFYNNVNPKTKMKMI